MLVDKFENKEFKSNTYIISVAGNSEVIIIDPAGDVEGIFSFLEAKGYMPQYIILTHEHFDHITGTNSFKNKYPNCDIICTRACAERIMDVKLNFSHYRNQPYISVPADILIDDCQTINWINQIECIPWEGHSPGGMLIRMNEALFCGDQFIKGIKTVTNLPGGNRDKVKKCYDFLKSSFSQEMMLYPGHGAFLLLKDLDFF